MKDVIFFDDLMVVLNDLNRIKQSGGVVLFDSKKILRDYALGKCNLDKSPNTLSAFNEYVQLVGLGLNDNICRLALERYKKEMCDINVNSDRKKTADNTTNMFLRDLLEAYYQIGIITKEQRSRGRCKGKTLSVLSETPALTSKQEQRVSANIFGEYYTSGKIENVDLPPKIIANAYKYLIKHRKERNSEYESACRWIEDYIDKLAKNFNDFNCMGYASRSGKEFSVVSLDNIADSYDGYYDLFSARLSVLQDNSFGNGRLQEQLRANCNRLREVIQLYDSHWNLENVRGQNKLGLSNKWDKLQKRLTGCFLLENTKRLLSRYKFLDENGEIIPQFVDINGRLADEYQNGMNIDPNSRLAKIILLAKQDISMKYLGSKEKISDDFLLKEFNETVVFKLYEVDKKAKLLEGVNTDLCQYVSTLGQKQFIEYLEKNGGSISDENYQNTIDEQVNKVAGYANRLKTLMGNNSHGKLFVKLFEPIKNIDKLHDLRTVASNKKAVLREKRIEFFTKILKSFATAGVSSAIINVVATAAATATGAGLATGMAITGVATSAVISFMQIYKWREEQKRLGKPSDVMALLQDKRLISTLGISLLAGAALVFGATGRTQLAMAMGYSALGLGGGKNTLEMYRDAKKSGMGTVESLTWALSNALSVIGGGMFGRSVSGVGIAAVNELSDDKNIFKTSETVFETQTETTSVEKTVYTDAALENAEHIAKSWYVDNLSELQNRVDLINEYNAVNGTYIDPYRAIMINADAGGHTFDNIGNHRVLSSAWGQEHGFSNEELHALKNMFTLDGGLNPDAMQTAIRADQIISEKNQVGWLPGLFDNVTYIEGTKPFHQVTENVNHDVKVSHIIWNPVEKTNIMTMSGVHYQKTLHEFGKLRNRLGGFFNSYNLNCENTQFYKPYVEKKCSENLNCVLPTENVNKNHEWQHVIPDSLQRLIEKPQVLDNPLDIIDGKNVYISSFPNNFGKIVRVKDWPVVVVDIDGQKYPFYCSTGFGKNGTAQVGKWNIMFGFYWDDKEQCAGWMNEGKMDDLKSYYNSSTVKRIAAKLDAVIGDVRNVVNAENIKNCAVSDALPNVASDKNAIDFINSGLKIPPVQTVDNIPMHHNDSRLGGREYLKHNIDAVMESLPAETKKPVVDVFDIKNTLKNKGKKIIDFFKSKSIGR